MRRSVRLSLSSRASDEHGVDTHADQIDNRRFGDGTLWSFGGVEVVDISQEPTPPIPIFRHEPGDHDGRVAVLFLRSGEVTVTHGGGSYRFSGGSAAFITTGTETSVEASDTCRVTIVSVPRAWLRAAGVEVKETFGAFAYSTARSSPLLSFVTALIEIVQLHSIPTEPTSTVLTQLVAGLFLQDNAYSVGSGKLELDLRTVADSLIALSSSEATFGASSLATQLHITLSQLERNFRSTGTRGSAAEAIRERRIMMAMLGLQTPEQNDLTTEEVAHRAGFSTVRELHRALKHTYGTTVKEVLLAQAGARATREAELT